MKTYDDLAGDGGSNIIDQVIDQREQLRTRLDQIKHKVCLMSGKGGVGKSSITANMAACLALRGHTVGILDADLNGPSIGKMLGVSNQEKLRITPEGVEPGQGAMGIKIMSMDMLLPNADSPVIWTEGKDATAVWVSTMESTALQELLKDTIWGKLDYLLIDMPPGSDRIDNIRDLIPELDGVVEITIPSPISQHIVSKSITKNSQLGVSIIGLVENMATYVCRTATKRASCLKARTLKNCPRTNRFPCWAASRSTRGCPVRPDPANCLLRNMATRSPDRR